MPFSHIDEFFEKATEYTSVFEVWVERLSPAAKADHICYKCGDRAEFEHLRSLFERESGYMYQSIISGRPIVVIKLARPLTTKLGDIWFLELSDQKPDGSQVSGFDHIEIYPTSGLMDELAAQLMGSGVSLEKIERPHHTTYDAVIVEHFKVRLESEPLIEKIKRDEMS